MAFFRDIENAQYEHAQTLLANADGELVVPEAFPLFGATFERSGQDLTLTNGQPAKVVKALLS